MHGKKKTKTRDDGDISVSAQDYTEGELYFKRQTHKERGYWWIVLLLLCAETCWYVQPPILQMAGNRNNVCSPQHNVLFERIESEALHKEELLSLFVSQAHHCLVFVYSSAVCVVLLSTTLRGKGKRQKQWLSLLCIHRAGRTSWTVWVEIIAEVNFFSFSLRRCLVKHIT